MSKHYVYSEDQAIIIPDGTILWNDESNDQSTLQYFDANDSTINESYATAIDSNETQYLSILDASNSNGISLEDLNLTIENEDDDAIGIPSENPDQEVSAESLEKINSDDNAEVVVFTMDGSDDLYGIQMTCDEAGNIQKYQFKFRATPDGQLEPIPETVTLLPDDNQFVEQQSDELEQAEEIESSKEQQEYFLVREQSDCNEETLIENGQVQELNLDHVYIKGESNALEMCETSDEGILENCIESVPDDTHLESQIENICVKAETSLQNNHSQTLNTVHVKGEEFLEIENDGQFEGQLFHETLHTSIICKDEEQYGSNSSNKMQLYQQETEASDQFEVADGNHEEHFYANHEEHTHQDLVQQLFCDDHNQIEVQYETELEQAKSPIQCEYSEVYENQENNMNYAVEYIQQTTEGIHANSNMEQYQHVISCEDVSTEVEEASIEPNTVSAHLGTTDHQANVQRTNIFKNPVTSDKENKAKLRYYVVYREKENVNSLAEEKVKSVSQALNQPKLTRVANPRSVLRTSFAAQKDHRLKRNSSIVPETDLFDKRFARNKDALRAKHFHNFLNKTTIPHAPVRQQRQPRKQEIKPIVERSRGEIIIQEVIVSSSGFVERPNKGTGENRVTAIVELSDSEEEATVEDMKRKRRSRTTSESDKSVILIHSDNEEIDNPKADEAKTGSLRSRSQRTPVRRKQKRKHRQMYKKVSEPSSKDLAGNEKSSEANKQIPQCDNRLLPLELIDLSKKEKKCPHCPKTFPSQNSLNTHLIHHNLENSLKNKARMSSKPSLIPTRQSMFPKVEYSHKCNECQSTFRNIILLQKHKCVKSSLKCTLCLKQFNDIVLLNMHKKVHAKSHLIKSTSIITVSPKKALLKSCTGVSKSPIVKSAKNFASKKFKCRECPRVCDSSTSLSSHTKLHNKFPCSSCFAQFSSKLLLDNHKATSCVKTNPSNKRISFLVGKSLVHTPLRRSSVANPTNKTEKGSLKEPLLGVKLNCCQCNKKFSTFRNLYAHRVQIHGMITPKKTRLTKSKKNVYKSKAGAHGGFL